MGMFQRSFLQTRY